MNEAACQALEEAAEEEENRRFNVGRSGLVLCVGPTSGSGHVISPIRGDLAFHQQRYKSVAAVVT